MFNGEQNRLLIVNAFCVHRPVIHWAARMGVFLLLAGYFLYHRYQARSEAKETCDVPGTCPPIRTKIVLVDNRDGTTF